MGRPYNIVPHTQIEGVGPFAKKVPINVTSYYYSGVVTTVQNNFYGIEAGQKIDLLVFSMDIPGYIWPALGDPDQTKIISPGHLRLADGAVMKDPDLIACHAPMAKSQANAFPAILKEFFSGGDGDSEELII